MTMHIVAPNGTKIGLYDAAGCRLPLRPGGRGVTIPLVTGGNLFVPMPRGKSAVTGPTPAPAPLLARLASRALYALAAGLAHVDRWRSARG